VNDAERLVVAGPEQRHQLLVGTQSEKWRPDESPSPRQACRCLES
jgi:hypothetical protein